MEKTLGKKFLLYNAKDLSFFTEKENRQIGGKVPNFTKISLGPGVFWLEHRSSGLRLLCGPVADSVKLLIKRGLIQNIEMDGQRWESGPNAILLSDVGIQNGELCNLSEFPILQMLYRQGFMLPNHPMNTGQKPLVMGSESQVKSQLEYIYRGNYGLASKEELRAVCSSEEEVQMMMAVKNFFAFGKINRPEQFIDGLYISGDFQNINRKVSVRRAELNRFEFSDGQEHVTVDLNLKPLECYPSPLRFSPTLIQEEFFSVIHCGEGDGWDVDRGCMGSMISYDHKFYLVDAAPNIKHTLQALGISLSMIDGVFITHAHDDHFAGLASLMLSHRPIKLYATKWVKESVIKKFSALLSLNEAYFTSLFDVCELKAGVWNNIDGLEVRPVYSPHPIETSIFKFRLLWKDGYLRYHHLADITSDRVLSEMEDHASISIAMKRAIKSEYLEPANLKKIDIGGGLIHGKAPDFADDRSEKIILAHKADDLTPEEKQIGSSATFGSVDVLIQEQNRYPTVRILQCLERYFPSVDPKEFRAFLQCPLETYGAGTILLKTSSKAEDIILIVAGIIERIDTKTNSSHEVLAGTLIGDQYITDHEFDFTFRTKSYVSIIRIPRKVYDRFLIQHNMKQHLINLYHRYSELAKSSIFHFLGMSPHFIDLVNSMYLIDFSAGDNLKDNENLFPKGLLLIRQGEVKMEINHTSCVHIGPGEICFEELLLEEANCGEIIAMTDGDCYVLPIGNIREVPILFWQVLEIFERRNGGTMSLRLAATSGTKSSA